MKKEMLINVLQPEECRIAIVENGVLEELYVERTSHESYTGNIYKGKVVNLEPAIQAAFVDFSVGRNGFLHVSDVEPQYYSRNQAGRRRSRAGRGTRRRSRRRTRGRASRDRDRDRDRDRTIAGAGPSRRASRLPPALSRPAPRRGSLPRPGPRPGSRATGPIRSAGRRDRSEMPRRFGEGLVDERRPPPGVRRPARAAARSSREPGRDSRSPRRHSHEARACFLARARGAGLGVSSANGERQRDSRERESRPEEPEETALAAVQARSNRSTPTCPPAAPSERGLLPPPPCPHEPEPDGARPLSRRARCAGDSRAQDEPRTRSAKGLAAEPPAASGTAAGPRQRGRPAAPPARPPRPERSRDSSRDREPEREPRATLRLPTNSNPIEEEPRFEEPPRGAAAGPRSGRAAVSAARAGAAAAACPSPAGLRARAAPGRGAAEGRAPSGTGPPEPERPGRSRPRASPRSPPRASAGLTAGPASPATSPAANGSAPLTRARADGSTPTYGAGPTEPIDPEPDIDSREFLAADEELAGRPRAVRFDAPEAREGKRRRRRRGRRRDRERDRPELESRPRSADDEFPADFDDLEPETDFTASVPPRPARPRTEVRRDRGSRDGPRRTRTTTIDLIEDEEAIGEDFRAEPVRAAEEEIDPELEQEIRKEIEEIEELEREMGLRGPAEARPRRGDEPARGRALRPRTQAWSSRPSRRSSAAATRCSSRSSRRASAPRGRPSPPTSASPAATSC